MISIAIPGRETVTISAVVLDYNGTIARDGVLLPGAAARIQKLTALADVYVLTADTYGTVAQQCQSLGVSLRTFPQAGAADCKAAIVRELGGGVFAVGNGFNDIPMLDAADLAIAVLEEEGLCAGLLPHADILVRSAEAALDLLLYPDRIRATLRS